MRLPIVALLLAGLVLVGCGDGGGGEEERARLVDSLGFLSDQGLTDAEIACTGRTIEEDLDGEDLDEVAAQVRRVEVGEIEIADLPQDVATTLTDSIASCAGTS